MTASARAMLLGGVLAASGDLAPGITPDAATAAIEVLIGPATIWCTTLPVVEGWQQYDRAVGEPPAAWVSPQTETVDAAELALEAAWAHVVRLLDRPLYIQPLLRLMTFAPADADALLALGPIDGLPVTTFTPAALGGWCWHWPLRVGVAASPAADARITAMRGNGEFAEHYDVAVMDTASSGPFDLVVCGPNDQPVPPAERTGALIVLGGPPNDRAALAPLLRFGEQLAPGATVAVPGHDLAWFPSLVRELSHDRPLDAAIGLVRPDAAITGHPHFFAMTALRNWTRTVADRAASAGNVELADALRPMLEDARFDSEEAGARGAGRAVRAAELSGAIFSIEGWSGPQAAAPPPEPGSGAGEEEVGEEVGEEVAGSGPPGPPTAAPARGLVARLTDTEKQPLTAGFTRGAKHLLSLRIAAQAAVGEIAASHPLLSPAPGRTVVLDVTVHIEGSRRVAKPVTLRYPATGDGPWTEAVAFTAPRRSGNLTVFVTVAWKGRVIQSATLTGPLTAKAAAAQGGQGMTFTVDVSSHGLADDDRVGAQATFVQLPARGATPVVFDAASGIPIDPDSLARANRQVRKTLINTFMHPPTSLAEAAAPLADLAVRGSLLRDALKGKDEEFFDTARWIHITSFGVAAIPFELLYTHPMPDLSGIVQVCKPALDGATDCAGDCPDRERTDRVCPFGFWATTKIIERRQHSAGRTEESASEQRIVPARRGGVVAVTPQANADDPTASTRIADAVAAFVTAGSSVAAASWQELEHAVESPRNIVCLVTHTIEPEDPDDDLAVELQLGAETRRLIAIDRRYINPDGREPGPIVLAMGCDTSTIHASFASFVARLHSLGAEIVVSTIAQIPGKETADFVERLMRTLDRLLAEPGEHRFGAVLTAARRETLCNGDVLALAVTATGDGDVQLGMA